MSERRERILGTNIGVLYDQGALVTLVSEPKQAESASFLLLGIQLLKQIPGTN